MWYFVIRISRWIDDEEDRIKAENEEGLRCVVPVASIDTSGTKMLEDLKMSLDTRSIQVALANPLTQGARS
ncbi:hypothetical protein EJB05_22785, partial [Eragrostis curvula]